MAVCYSTTPPPRLLLGIYWPKWVLGGWVLTVGKVLRVYAPGVVHNMAQMGVNTVHIPVPCQVFHDNVVVNGYFPHTVSRLLDRAKGARLKVILVLVRGTGENVLGL